MEPAPPPIGAASRSGLPPAGEPFLSSVRGWMLGGRWLLAAAETLESAILILTGLRDPTAHFVLGLLFVYNTASLALVYRMPLRPRSLLALFAGDLTFVAAAAYQTGGSASPFLGQCYLIIFAAAMVYGRAGGVLAGLASALIAIGLALPEPAQRLIDLRDVVPYFLIAGGFAGFLVDRMQVAFRFYQEGERQERRRAVEAEGARREMELARAMQQAALPSGPPDVPGLDVAARTDFAHQVGGDFYLFLRSECRVGIVVGDVCGKGLPAALAATSISHLLPWLDPLDGASAALENLNRDLVERLPEGSFVTLALAEIDTAAGRLRLWSAGHPPALIYRAAGNEVAVGEARGPLLGVFPSWSGSAWECAFDRDDVLLLYSDGLVETRQPGKGLFGTGGASLALAAAAGRGAAEIVAGVLEAARAWGSVSDDVTLVACRRAGA